MHKTNFFCNTETAKFNDSQHATIRSSDAPYYITKPEQLKDITPEIRKEIEDVSKTFAFRTNSYYASLIDWDDPNDPIRRISIPTASELSDWGSLDASNEHVYQKVPGLEHKYSDTAILLTTSICGSFCRFCFRKRLFMSDNIETAGDISEGIDYIRSHPEITNVLLTGGDPLILSTKRLSNIIREIRDINHVQIIRIGSKMVAFNPHRILNDPELIDMFNEYSQPCKRIYIMTHFNHPRELTGEAIRVIDKLLKAGVILANQTPLLKGVNDSPQVLGELLNKLSYYGVPPYYVFQCRPTIGNEPFALTVEKAIEIFDAARKSCSGLAKRSRLIMSHETGKIEILGKTGDTVIFRYFRSADSSKTDDILFYKSNPKAYWFDDYTELVTK